MSEGKELDSLSRHLYLFEYKGVKITGHSRDEVALLRGRLKTEIDLKIYNERAKEILFSYIPESDYELNEQIQKELQEMEEELSNR
jgi:hypothetical protein